MDDAMNTMPEGETNDENKPKVDGEMPEADGDGEESPAADEATEDDK